MPRENSLLQKEDINGEIEPQKRGKIMEGKSIDNITVFIYTRVLKWKRGIISHNIDLSISGKNNPVIND